MCRNTTNVLSCRYLQTKYDEFYHPINVTPSLTLRWSIVNDTSSTDENRLKKIMKILKEIYYGICKAGAFIGPSVFPYIGIYFHFTGCLYVVKLMSWCNSSSIHYRLTLCGTFTTFSCIRVYLFLVLIYDGE